MKGSDGSTVQKPKKRPGRVPSSCAECRRLKMKCDRRHPCENCKKRGCAAICPDGTLTTGKYNRMILTNTEELHERVESLLERIRMLEDALRTLQASVSTRPHPLLAQQTSSEEFTPTIDASYSPHVDNSDAQQTSQEEEEVLMDSFGILTHDAVKYLLTDTLRDTINRQLRRDEISGSNCQSRSNIKYIKLLLKYLLQDTDSDDGYEYGRLPKEFYSHTWPESPPPSHVDEDLILSFLPDLNEAYLLSQVYLEYGNWLSLFIPREQLYNEIIAHVYHLPNHPWADTKYTCPHRLSLLFSIFSLGAFLERRQKPYGSEADDFYHLARVALSLKSVVLDTTVHAVLAITHMSYFLDQNDSPYGQMQAWVMLGIAAKLAYSMGLHLDSSRWKLDDDISQSRHMTFWQLYVTEVMASLQLGRPSLLSEAFIECPLPGSRAYKQIGNDIDNRQSYHIWLIQFSRLSRHIAKEAFGAKVPSYSVIMDLDNKIRCFAEPNWPLPSIVAKSHYDLPVVQMQQWCTLWLKERTLLLLHRSFLVLAMSSQDPLGSRYGQSINACHCSASNLIEGLDSMFKKFPDTISKTSCWFADCVLAAIVMCLLVMRCPVSTYTSSSLERLDTICDILQKMCGENRSSQRNLEVTQRLRRMAKDNLDRARSNKPVEVQSIVSLTEEVTVLDRLTGKTRLQPRRSKTPANGERATMSTRSSLSPDTNAMEDVWEGRDTCGSSWPSAGSLLGGTDFSCGGFYSTNGQGLDATWHNFVQQLGF